ncbi:Caulimovirus viroplasmin-domain-containing protein [Dactylonectria macrodidyma]|uniref:ribonuclease H n=1 Tax=Dactylonectria macrodidyma TaxID=307937 RepID=A0A9P9JFG7_9HYPO|nr:Caulimovirus viroplasmin-domain-containing protein [Dactylonectria macrodidyma]
MDELLSKTLGYQAYCLGLNSPQAMTKFYAVQKGRQTGVFTTWDECQESVKNYKGSNHKGFNSEKDAWEFVRQGTHSKSDGLKSDSPEFDNNEFDDDWLDDDELPMSKTGHLDSPKPAVTSSPMPDKTLQDLFKQIRTTGPASSSGSGMMPDRHDFDDWELAIFHVMKILRTHKAVRITPGTPRVPGSLAYGVSKLKKSSQPKRR